MVGVASTVRLSCVGSLASMPKLGRGVDCAQGQGSGEAVIALEAGARARHWLLSRPRLGRGTGCARGQGSGESLVALQARARVSRWLRSRLGLGRVTGCTRGRGLGLVAYPYRPIVPFLPLFPLG